MGLDLPVRTFNGTDALDGSFPNLTAFGIDRIQGAFDSRDFTCAVKFTAKFLLERLNLRGSTYGLQSQSTYARNSRYHSSASKRTVQKICKHFPFLAK